MKEKFKDSAVEKEIWSGIRGRHKRRLITSCSNKQNVRRFNRNKVAAKSSPKVETGLKDYKGLNLTGSNCADKGLSKIVEWSVSN